jgi:hypothetical protein
MSSTADVARRVLAASFLAAIAALASACSSGSGAAAPTSTVTVTQTPVSAPASTPTQTPTSTPPAPTECTTAALKVSVGSSQGAAGTIYYSIDFTNVSGSGCVVQGYPGVSLVSHGSNAGSQIGADGKRTSATAVRLVTLAPGQIGHATLAIAQAGAFSQSSCRPVSAHWLKVFPPDQTVAAYVPFSTQTCASTSRPTMRISAIAAGA